MPPHRSDSRFLTDVQFRKSRGKLHTDLTAQGLRLVIPIRPSSFQTKSDYSYIKTRCQSSHRIDVYLVKKSIISFLISSYIMCIVINMTEASSGHKRRRSSLKRSSSLEIELTTAASGAALHVVDMLLAAAPEHVLLKDERGFTPFDYVRRQDHGKWLRFLWERKHKLRPTNSSCSISNDSSEGMK
jgi:hypothetical protein